MAMNMGGSFWTSDMVSSIGPSSSPLDDLLETGTFTLEQLLNQDDVIQECKAMNSVLVEFLCRPQNTLSMINYITSIPTEEKVAADPNLEKYPFVCSELFACELVSMFDALLGNIQAMDQLFGFVSKNEKLNPTLAGYFRKVVGVLIQRKYEDLAEYIQNHPEVLTHLINHVDSTSIMEVLIMLGWDDGFYQHSNDVNWLLKLKFIPQIVNKLSKDFDEDIHINASYTLVDVITKSPPSQESPLMQHVQSPTILEQLLNHVFSDCESSFVHGVRVVIALLQRAVQFEADFAADTAMVTPELDAVITRLPDLLVMLNKVPRAELPTSYGKLNPPLGEVRLRAAELTCNLVQFDKASLQAKMGELKLIPKLLDLFFEYPWHNILHNLVESAIQIILAAEEGKLTEFRRSLIHDGKLLDRVMDAYHNHYEIEKRGAFKLGNMAFVSRISLIFVDRQDKDSEIRGLVGDQSKWKTFVDNDIERERERLMTILGGHRPNMGGFDEFSFDGSQEASAEEQKQSFSYGYGNSTTFSEEGQVLDDGDDDDGNWHEDSNFPKQDADEQAAVVAEVEEIQGAQPLFKIVEKSTSN